MKSSSQPPSETVIQQVSEQVGTDPLELPPLYSVIDPDALDATITGMDQGEVQFQYAGHIVTVRTDGTVHLTTEPTSETERPTSTMRE